MKDYLEKRREELAKREGGFTLMEMLIVVAIIAVLIAIAIPVFTSQLENSREATDAANLRSAYATASATVLMENGKGVCAGPVAMTQSDQNSWSNDSLKDQKIGNLKVGDITVKDQLYVHVDKDGKVTIDDKAASGDEVAVDPSNGAKTTSSASSEG